MSEPTKDEKNRAIAEWIEPCPTGQPWTIPMLSAKCGWTNSTPAICDGRHVYTWVPRDFYTDEAASALLLDKFIDDMAAPKTTNLFDYIAGRRLLREKRRAAIAEAALKLIESERVK